MTKKTSLRKARQREQIAQRAAQLIAEEGIQDYGLAKRKAARQYGVQDTEGLPGNKEVEEALKIYYALYQKDEQAEQLFQLRHQALRYMRLFEAFHPYLVGTVLSGVAGRYSEITLNLYTDNAKAVEMFLLNRKMLYKAGDQRLRLGSDIRNVPVFTLTGDQAEVHVVVLEPADLHANPKNLNEIGSPDYASIKQVEALVQQAPDIEKKS